MRPTQRQAEHAQHCEAQSVARPPDAQGIQQVGADHRVQRHGAERGRRQGRDAADGQEARQALDAVDVKPGHQPPRQHHGKRDLHHVGDGEHQRQRRAVADQELARQHARRDQHGETAVVGQAASAAQPQRKGQAARAPQGRHQTVGAGEADRQHHHDGHPHDGQDRRQGLAEEGRIGLRRRRRGGRKSRGLHDGFSPFERGAHRHNRVQYAKLPAHPAPAS
ncbi:hypothetical protein D3C73_634900 [compost metagenome]